MGWLNARWRVAPIGAKVLRSWVSCARVVLRQWNVVVDEEDQVTCLRMHIGLWFALTICPC